MNTSMNDTTNGGRVPSVEDLQSAIEQCEQIAAQATAVEPSPCPAWCTRPAGHPYEPVEEWTLDYGLRRDHERTIGGVVDVTAEEIRQPDGTLTVGPPAVLLDTSRAANVDQMTAERAYELGKMLRQAALLAQRIEREMSR